MADETRLRFLGLNCWGLKFVAKELEARINAIVEKLGSSDYDVITLQEIWVFAHFEKVQARVANRLPYSKFYYGGALGAGLAIFSRFPIVETSVHPYSLNGEPTDVLAGDWFVGKAAASAVILHPVLGQVQVFNTHLFAKGGEWGPEWQRAHRLVNAWELAKLARQAAHLGRYVVIMGDLNSIPGTLPMTIILEHTATTDAWLVTHSSVDVNSVSTAEQAVDALGITADSPINTWSAQKSYIEGFGKRLDYCLYRQPVRRGENPPILAAVETKVVFTERVPGLNTSYSDHFGLEATLEIRQPTNSDRPTESDLSSATIATTIQALTDRLRMAKDRSRKEMIIFYLGLVLLLGVAVGTAWLPHSWINPIFIVFTIFIAWLTTTMLYEGFLFGNWEQRALLNVIEELEVHRNGVEIVAGRRSG